MKAMMLGLELNDHSIFYISIGINTATPPDVPILYRYIFAILLEDYADREDTLRLISLGDRKNLPRKNDNPHHNSWHMTPHLVKDKEGYGDLLYYHNSFKGTHPLLKSTGILLLHGLDSVWYINDLSKIARSKIYWMPITELLL